MFHRSGTVEHRVVHVDVDDGSAAFNLVGCNLQGRCVIAGSDQPGEFARTGHIGPFTDRRQVVVPDVDRHVFQAAHAEQPVRLWDRPGRDIFQGGCQGCDMVGCRAAATAHDVHAAGLGSLPDGIGHLPGKFLVLPHGVGQAGVGVADYGEVADMGEVFNQRHQTFCTQRTVEAEGQEGIMPDGGQEGFDRLAGQGPSGAVAGRDGDDGREAGTHLRKRVQRGFRVEGIETGLDEDQVGAAFDKRCYLFAVHFRHLVEGQRLGGFFGQVGAQCQRFRRGSDTAGYPDLSPASQGLVGLPPGDAGPFAGESCRLIFQSIFFLGDAVAAEGVGLDDVGAGLDVSAVDCGDKFRLGAVERIEIAALPVALQHRAHRPVEQQDPFPQGQPDSIKILHVAKISFFEKKRRRKRVAGRVFHYI